MDQNSRSSWIIAPRKSTDSKALRPYFSSIKKPITRIFARPANYIEAQPTQRYASDIQGDDISEGVKGHTQRGQTVTSEGVGGHIRGGILGGDK